MTKSVRQDDDGATISTLPRVSLLSPVEPTTRLSDRLSQRIIRLIESGEFPEGSRLPAESILADRFGVSRPVIREALSRLRSMGAIVSRKGAGSYVQYRAAAQPDQENATPFGFVSSLSQIRRCFEFRAAVESEAAFHAARNRTQVLLLHMRETVDQLEKAVSDGALGVDPDVEFHMSIAKASCNEFFEFVSSAMRSQIEFSIDLARRLSLTRPQAVPVMVQAEHEEIFRAIEAQNSEAARVAMRRHVENACSRIFEGSMNVASAPDVDDSTS
jgi:DNA-binding FadR family transcriptional regulator